MKNITKKQLIDEITELRRSEERHRLMVQQAPTGIYEIDFITGKFIMVNEVVCQYTGFSREELLEKKAIDLLSENSKIKFFERMKKIAGGDKVTDTVEYEIVGKNDKRSWVILSSKYKEKDGRIIGGMVMAKDISNRKRIEHELSESEEKFRIIAENVTDAIWTLDMNLNRTYVSPSIKNIIGYSVEEAMGTPINAWYTEESMNRAITAFREELEIDRKADADPLRTRTLTMEIRHKDGSQVWVEEKMSFIRDETGSPIGVIGVTRDITERRRMEQELRDREEKFRLLAENSTDVIWTADINLNFTYLSPSIYKLSGYTPEESIKMTVQEMLTPESYRFVMDTFAREYEKYKDKAGEPYRSLILEIDQYRKDGTVVPTEVQVTGIRNEEDRLIGMLGITRDITERRKSEEEIRQSEERYRFLVNNVLVGLFICEMDSGRFIYLNDRICDIFGYTMDEALEQTVWDVIIREEHDMVRQRTIDKIKGRRSSNASQVYTALRKDGIPIKIEVSANPVSYQGLYALQGIVMDITETEMLQKQLLHAQKMEAIGTLAGGIAHDFNNLLMGIQGNASLMLMDLEYDETYLEKLDNIQQYVKSGVELTKQLLGLARGGKYEIQPTDINDLIGKSSGMFGRTHKEIKIFRKMEREIRMVEIDRGQIEQVLINLYVNAWQAMPEGGVMRIMTENVLLSHDEARPHGIEGGSFVKITVSDTGEGMDEKTMERIFDPFFTTKEMGRGTGLGLSSAYGIIKNHGGFITVSSRKGDGSLFNIFLRSSDREPESPIKETNDLLYGSETILIVDDETMILQVTGQMLKKLGYSVMEAQSGYQAVEIYRGSYKSIDLVVLDMIMPDMKGEDTFERLSDINPGLKVLLSSGYTISDEAGKIMEKGNAGFIQKPFDIKMLSIKIRDMLDG